MSSRERRLLDKDKEIRKLKSTAGHYFNCTIDGAIKIYKLEKALDVAIKFIKAIEADLGKGSCASKALDEINEITKELKDENR